jgi:hypothetical protein
MAQIHRQSDLKRLCEVSKYIAEVATPRLYESITLHADEMLDLHDLIHKIELCSNDNAVKYTKNICLRAPLYHNLGKRCPHNVSRIPETLGGAIDVDDEGEVWLQRALLFSTPKDAEEFILGGCHEPRCVLGLIYGTYQLAG